MKQIPLTRNQFSLVDDCDYEAVMAVGKWHYTKHGYSCHYWRDANGGRHTLYLHRFIFARILGHDIPRGRQIDHISAREEGKQARLNNQRYNLRLVNCSQNQAAKGPQKNTRAHKGCTLRAGKLDVRVRYLNYRLHLGRYADFEVAVAVYGYAHRLLWGSFTSEPEPNSQLLSADVLDKVNERIAKMMRRFNA